MGNRRWPPDRHRPPPGGSAGSGAGRPRPPPTESDDPRWLPTLAWTVGYFLAPVSLYLAWAATRSGTAPAGCTDFAGAPCPSPRAEALAELVGMAPGLATAVVLALVAAVVLRSLTTTWRPGAAGFAAAVLGAGAATLTTPLLA